MEQRIDKILADAPAGFGDTRGHLEALSKRRHDEHWERLHIEREWLGVDHELRRLLWRLLSGCEPWPLYLHGPVGTGKTRAGLVVCDIMDNGRFWTVQDVMDAMSERRAPWNTANHARLTVLDELGLEECGDDPRGRFEYGAVKAFLDWREERPAIYLSNHPLEVVGQLYDRRIASRLGAGTVHFLDGPDRRFHG
jgi:hypothetical protein